MEDFLDVVKGMLATVALGATEHTFTGELELTWRFFALVALFHVAWVGLRPPRRRRLRRRWEDE